MAHIALAALAMLPPLRRSGGCDHVGNDRSRHRARRGREPDDQKYQTEHDIYSRRNTAPSRRERILVLDGAMGTMIQALELDEAGYRGARFDAWNREVRGNNDLLDLTQPDAVRDIHLAYFRAGADIVSTNTFSSTRIAQADYGMANIAYEFNVEGARLAREAADIAQREDGRPRFVAGAIGPTNRTASISPDVVQSGLPRHHLRRAAHRLRRTGARPDRRAAPTFC